MLFLSVFIEGVEKVDGVVELFNFKVYFSIQIFYIRYMGVGALVIGTAVVCLMVGLIARMLND